MFNRFLLIVFFVLLSLFSSCSFLQSIFTDKNYVSITIDSPADNAHFTSRYIETNIETYIVSGTTNSITNVVTNSTYKVNVKGTLAHGNADGTTEKLYVDGSGVLTNEFDLNPDGNNNWSVNVTMNPVYSNTIGYTITAELVSWVEDTETSTTQTNNASADIHITVTYIK
jgi:hypothetical protein